MNDNVIWMNDVTSALAKTPGLKRLLIAHPASAALSRDTAADGYPGVLPLWDGRNYVVGLLARPDAPRDRWPGVIIQDRQAITLSTDSRTLLPQFMIHRLLSYFPRTAQTMAEQWSEIRDDVVALHHALGGVDDTLDPVIEIASDPGLRQTFGARDARRAFEAAHSMLCRRVDSSPEFVQYAAWLDALIDGERPTVDDLAPFGAWERRVMSIAALLTYSHRSPPLLGDDALQRAIEEDAGIDSGMPTHPTWAVRIAASPAPDLLDTIAQILESAEPTDDEASAGMREALLAEGASYRGLAHAEAVPLLDERGEPERAWKVLQSAAWWAATNAGGVPEPLTRGAHMLAEEHGWNDILFMLNRTRDDTSVSELPGS